MSTDTADQLKRDLAGLRSELTVARANHDQEQVVLLQLDIATVQQQIVRQLIDEQRAKT